MKRLALTQPALNLVAKTEEGRTLLREKRREAQAKRDHTQREYDKMMAEVDGLIERIGIALGEVSA